MAEETDSSVIVSAAMIVGGVGSFLGASYVADARTRLILRAGGILSVAGGLFVGGSALWDKLKSLDLFGSFLGAGAAHPTYGPALPATPHESGSANGVPGGHWVFPSENQIVDVGTLGSGINVTAMVTNPTNAPMRVHVTGLGVESYLISSDEATGLDLGEVTIPPMKSIQVAGVYNLGTTILAPFASASVTLKLLIDGVEVDRVHFQYE